MQLLVHKSIKQKSIKQEFYEKWTKKLPLASLASELRFVGINKAHKWTLSKLI